GRRRVPSARRRPGAGPRPGLGRRGGRQPDRGHRRGTATRPPQRPPLLQRRAVGAVGARRAPLLSDHRPLRRRNDLLRLGLVRRRRRAVAVLAAVHGAYPRVHRDSGAVMWAVTQKYLDTLPRAHTQVAYVEIIRDGVSLATVGMAGNAVYTDPSTGS